MSLKKLFFMKNVILTGPPNSGKTTLFNVLTGLKQKTSLIPGTTVTINSGEAKIGELKVKVVDIPGLYSLDAISNDEKVALQNLLEGINKDYVIVCVGELTNPEKSLSLLLDILRKTKRVILAFNMLDEIEKKGISVNFQKLSERLGIPVIGISAKKKLNVDELKDEIINNLLKYDKMPSSLPFEDKIADKPNPVYAKHKIINSLISEAFTGKIKEENLTRKLDSFLLRPIPALISIILIFVIMFSIVFGIGGIIVEQMDTGMGFLIQKGKELFGNSLISNFLLDGVVNAIGTVILFIPYIFLMFFFITLLEDCGYMSRLAIITDKLLSKIGLNGKSIVPLIGGFGCAIPAILSTRTIPSLPERLRTILTIPVMTCSARIPVYSLVLFVLVPPLRLLGFLDLRTIVMISIYITGTIMAIMVAFISKKIVLPRESKSPFILELPPYRLPTLKSIIVYSISRTNSFIFSAGKIIFISVLIIWWLSKFGFSSFTSDGIRLVSIEESFLRQIGDIASFIFSPLGFDWKISTSILFSFIAREVFVGSLAGIYGLEREENNYLLIEQIKNSGSITLYNGLPLIAFYMFSLQCISTIMVIYQETKSVKFVLFAFVFLFTLAYLFALATKIILGIIL